jgi:MFS family permease
MFTLSTIATGLVALPAGLICEHLGTKKTLIIGLTANFANFVQIIVLQPSVLLFASLVFGLVNTLAWVASAPFMMENSRQEERTHLFSFNWASMIIMGVIGSYFGGVMPDSFNALLGLPTGVNAAPIGYRITLATSVVLALLATIPILLIKESKMLKRQKMGDFLNLRNIKTKRTIIKFMIPTAIIGFGAGFIVPLFNLFFKLKFYATDEEIGIISALGNVALGLGTFVAPVLSRKLGKVKSVVLCEYLSMPFIMLMTLAPNLVLAGASYSARNALMNMAGPLSSALQMELVTESERATTNGLMVMADNVPRAITASISGGMMTISDFYTPFLATTITYFTASSLYLIFFRKAEVQTIEARSETAC